MARTSRPRTTHRVRHHRHEFRRRLRPLHLRSHIRPTRPRRTLRTTRTALRITTSRALFASPSVHFSSLFAALFRLFSFFGLFFWLRLFAANADKYGYAVALLPSGQYAQPSALCSRFTASIRALFSSIKKAPSHYPFLRDTDVERSHVGDRTQNANPCPMPAEKLRR